MDRIPLDDRPGCDPELVKAINKYQDLYITEQMGIK